MKLDSGYLTAACTQAHVINIDKLCRSAPPGDFMECGVLRGGTAAVIINAAEGKRKIWLCDTFDEFPLKGPKDVNIDLQPSVGYTIPHVTKNLETWGVQLDNVNFIKGLFGDVLPEAMKKIKGLALVHFDGDWHESVMQAFPHILPKLVPGGILIIHDYPRFKGLADAVHKFIDPKDLHVLETPDNPTNVYYIKGE